MILLLTTATEGANLTLPWRRRHESDSEGAGQEIITFSAPVLPRHTHTCSWFRRREEGGRPSTFLNDGALRAEVNSSLLLIKMLLSLILIHLLKPHKKIGSFAWRI